MSCSGFRRLFASLVTAAVLGTTLALAGCSSAGSETAPGSPAQPLAPDGSTSDSRAAQPGEDQAGPQATETQKVVRTASLLLAVSALEPTAAAVRNVAASLGGQVTNENLNASTSSARTPSSSVPAPAGSSGTLTIDVPADRLDPALEQLSALGRVVQRTSNARDVTATYVDTESRIATKKASIERVRALMSQATGLSQVVELESQLAQREAELESLQATLATLQKKVAMSTVTVTLSTDPSAGEDASGFLGGLRAGWQAFLRSLASCLTALGAVLPFVGALAILVLPLLVWWRRREHSASTSAPPARTPVAASPSATAQPDEQPEQPEPEGQIP